MEYLGTGGPESSEGSIAGRGEEEGDSPGESGPDDDNDDDDFDDNDDDGDLPTHQWGGGCAPLSRRKASGSTNTFITGGQRSI